MERIFIPLYRFFRRHKFFMYFLMIASSVVFLYYGSKIVFIEDITKLLPQEGPASKSSLVFDDLKVKDMIMIQVTAEGAEPEDIARYSDDFANLLRSADKENYISNILTGIDTETFMEDNLDLLQKGEEYVRSHVPTFFNESKYEQFDSLLTPEAIDKAMCKWDEALYDAEDEDQYNSILNMLGEDPAGLATSLLPSNGPEIMGGVKIINGHLMSADSTVALAFLAPSFNSVDSQACADLVSMVEEQSLKFEEAHPGVDVLFHGLPVNGAYNSRQIKKDVFLTIGISLLIICIIFGYIFRNKSTLPLLLAPIAWGAMFALACLYWIQGTVSLLAMGIGAVILGVALSYCLHIITHYKYVSEPEKVLKDQSTPVLLGCITTVGAFVALLFTNSDLLKDFGIFATLSITGTVIFSLVFTPHFLKPNRNKMSRKAFKLLDKISAYPFDKLVTVRWMTIIACVVCVWASYKVGFDSDLRNIGYHDKEVIRSREVYSDKFNDGNLSVYFATCSDTLDNALAHTSVLTQALDSLKMEGKVCSYMDMTQIFVPEAEQQNRIDKWNSYWTDERIKQVEADLYAAAENYPDLFFDGMFDNFIQTVSNEDYTSGSLYDQHLLPDEIISNFIDQASGKYLVMTSAVLPHECRDDVSAVLNQIPDVVVVDPNFYTAELVKMVNDDFNKVLGISSMFVFIVLLLSFRSIMLAIIAFMPMSLSWYVVKGVMGLLGLDFNMINIVIATFIFGVGVDYSIFVMKGLLAKAKGQDGGLLLQHKTAIFLSAFMLILVLGSLLFATHPAINSIGFTTLIGMTSTVLLTYTIQPAFFRLMMRFKFFRKKVEN